MTVYPPDFFHRPRKDAQFATGLFPLSGVDWLRCSKRQPQQRRLASSESFMNPRIWLRLLCIWCIGWAAFGLVVPAASAQTAICASADPKVVFKDGTSACLKEFGLFNIPVPRVGFVDGPPQPNYSSLASSNPQYAISFNADPQMCPFAQRIEWKWSGKEAEKALPGCEERLKQAVQANGKATEAVACKCDVLIDNGKSTLGRNEFLAKTQLYERQISLKGRPLQVVDEEIARAKKQEEDRKFAEAEAARKKQQQDDAERVAKERAAQAERERLAQAQRERLERERPPAVAQIAPRAPKLTARALVIGNTAYTNFNKLPNSTNDARDIADKLTGFGIEVDLLLDADRDSLIKALNDYQAKASEKDVNLFFYAGHAMQAEGINYIIPVNMRADSTSVGYVKLAGISLPAVMDYMAAKTRLVFLDACRDNPAVRALVASRSGSAQIGLAPVSTTTGTLIAYATKEGSVAADGNGRNSPYTTALLRHLDAPMDISLVLRRVRQTVLEMTANQQEPWDNSSLVGDQLVLSQMAR